MTPHKHSGWFWPHQWRTRDIDVMLENVRGYTQLSECREMLTAFFPLLCPIVFLCISLRNELQISLQTRWLLYGHTTSKIWKQPPTSHSVTVQSSDVLYFSGIAEIENCPLPFLFFYEPSLFIASTVLKVKTHPGIRTGGFLSSALVPLGHCRTRLLYLGKASGNAATGRSAQTRLDLQLSFHSVDHSCNINPLDWQKVHKLGSVKWIAAKWFFGSAKPTGYISFCIFCFTAWHKIGKAVYYGKTHKVSFK